MFEISDDPKISECVTTSQQKKITTVYFVPYALIPLRFTLLYCNLWQFPEQLCHDWKTKIINEIGSS